jgi:2'-5' RNA ligase
MRLFCGVFPPPDVAAAIGEQLDALDLPRGRWVQDSQLHMTLAFLGEVPSSSLAQMSAALVRAAASQSRFWLELGQLDAFPSFARARVVFLRALRGEAELNRLAERLAAELPAELRPADSRDFHAHLTLARFAEPPQAAVMHTLSDRLAAARFAFEVQRLDLMHSELGRGGARYGRVHAAPMSPPRH